ncbi:hypothetical protein HMPREF1432_01360 [Helicobacter pylori GAMchJs114i]|nr:hypothetical protein HMPREF1432_01360 [Helicobacter pylori GAMchJs114i]
MSVWDKEHRIMCFSLFGKNKSHEFLESYFNGCKTPHQTKTTTL